MKPFRYNLPVDKAVFARWFAVLALGDLAFIGLETVLRAAVHWRLMDKVPSLLMVTNDGTLPEFYNYAKWVVIGGVLGWAFFRTRAKLFLAFAVTFLVVLADDSLQLHELFGAAVAEAISAPTILGLKTQYYGEMALWAILGVLVTAMLWHGFRTSDAAARRLGLPLLAIFGALVATAVGMDVVHSLVDLVGVGRLSVVVGLLEDGGEMLLGSAAGAYAVALAAQLGLRPQRLREASLA